MEHKYAQEGTLTIHTRPLTLKDEPGLEKFFIAPVSTAICSFVAGYNAVLAIHNEKGLESLARQRGLSTANLQTMAEYKKLESLIQDLFALGFPIPNEEVESLRNILKYNARAKAQAFTTLLFTQPPTKDTAPFINYLRRIDETLEARYNICAEILRNAEPIIAIFSDPVKARPYLQTFYLANELGIDGANTLHFEKIMVHLQKLTERLPKAPSLPFRLPLTLEIK